jgi:GTPase KRas protein
LDTADQEKYITMRDQWIRAGEGFVLVYSITSRSFLTQIQKVYDQIRRVKEVASAEYPTGMDYSSTPSRTKSRGRVSVMLVGNKSDKVTESEVFYEKGSILARKLEYEFVETSAKNCVKYRKGIPRRGASPQESAAKNKYQFP